MSFDPQASHTVRQVYDATFPPTPVEGLRQVEKGVKLNGLGTAVAIFMSIASILFTGGVVYGQVQQNTAKISSLESRVDSMSTAIIRIDTNVTYLADRAKEDRALSEERQARK